MADPESFGDHLSAQDADLDRIFQEVSERVERGQDVDVAWYVRQYPVHADQLRKALPGILALANLGHKCTLSTDEAGPPLGELGDYRIFRELGRGGMGVVYEAEQVSLSRRVALKVLPFATMLDERQLIRFRNEARAAATLNHPNIVSVIGVGQDRGVHYYAMQLIEGSSLAEAISRLEQAEPSAVTPTEGAANSPTQRHHPRNENETLAIAIISTQRSQDQRRYFRTVAQIGLDVARALEHAHERGILHRDVKPANILLTSQQKHEGGNKGVAAMLTDFGLARIEGDAGVTMTGDLLGTLRYMSPEQALAQRVVIDHRTDIYSLGITLYELATLRPAFSGSDRQHLLKSIAFEEPTPPRKLQPQMPADLDTIIQKCIEKSPADRYASAADLGDDLRRLLAHETIRATPPSILTRFHKWTRRNATVVTAIGAAGILISLVLAWSTWRVTKALGKEQQESVAARQAEASQREATTAAQRERALARKSLYAAQIHQAFQDWSSGRCDRILSILDQWVKPPGEPDYRGWEWYYLLSLCHQEQRSFRGHFSPVLAVAWSPAGDRIASGDDRGSLIIWDARSGRSVWNTHQDTAVAGVAWSPDGTQIASVCHDASLTIWDAATGRTVRQWPPDPDRQTVLSPRPLFWSADGRRLLDSTCTIELTTGNRTQLADYLPGTNDVVALDGEHSRIALADFRHRIRIFNLPDNPTPVLELQGDRHSFCFSPDGKQFLWAGYAPPAYVYSLATGVTDLVLPHDVGVQVAAWSHDGRRIAIATWSELGIYDAKMGTLLRTHRLSDVSMSLGWSPDDRQIVTGLYDGTIQVWDADEGKAYYDAVVPSDNDQFGLNGTGESAAWTRDGKYIVVRTEETKSAIVNTQSRTVACVIPGKWFAGAISPDGSKLATCDSVNGKTQVWELQTGTQFAEIPVSYPRNIVWHPSEPKLNIVDGERIISWNLDAEALEAVYLPPIRPFGVAVNSTGNRLAVPTREGPVFLYDLPSGKLSVTLLGHREGSFVFAADWSADGGRLATGGWDRVVRIWDTNTSQELAQLDGHLRNLRSLDWNPDATRLLSSDAEQTRLWNMDTATELTTFAAACAVWSPDGRRILLAADGRWKIMDASVGYDLASSPAFASERARRKLRKSRELTRSRRYDEALTLLTEAATLDDSNPEIQFELARLLTVERVEQAKVEDVDRAIPFAQRAIELQPADPRFWGILGIAHARAGNWADAQRAFVRSGPLDETRLELVRRCYQACANYMRLDQASAREELAECITLFATKWRGTLESDTANPVHLLRAAELMSDATSAIRLRQVLSSEGSFVSDEQLRSAARQLQQMFDGYRDDHHLGLQLAAVQLALRDLKGFGQTCHALAERHGQSEDAGATERVAKLCLLVPDVEVDPAVVHRCLESTLRSDMPETWKHLLTTLAAYRRGDYAGVIQDSKPTGDATEVFVSRQLLLAMSYFRSGDRESAVRVLDDLEIQFPQMGRRARPEATDWLICGYLYEEAKNLIASDDASNKLPPAVISK